MTSPAYLRDLALKFAATQRPRDLAIAERLRAIADELDHLQVRDQQTADTPRPPRDLTAGVTSHIRALHATAPLTPAQLEELRNMRKSAKP